MKPKNSYLHPVSLAVLGIAAFHAAYWIPGKGAILHGELHLPGRKPSLPLDRYLAYPGLALVALTSLLWIFELWKPKSRLHENSP